MGIREVDGQRGIAEGRVCQTETEFIARSDISSDEVLVVDVDTFSEIGCLMLADEHMTSTYRVTYTA